MARTITITDENGDDVELPAIWAICDCCHGEGSRALHGEAITSSEWANDWDIDERESYMRGDYDTPCEACQDGKVLTVDYDNLTPEKREQYEAHCKFEVEYRQQEAYERRYGY